MSDSSIYVLDLLLVCSMANTTCSIIVIMTTLIFIIVSLSVACVHCCCSRTLVLPRTSGSCVFIISNTIPISTGNFVGKTISSVREQ